MAEVNAAVVLGRLLVLREAMELTEGVIGRSTSWQETKATIKVGRLQIEEAIEMTATRVRSKSTSSKERETGD